MTTTITDIRVFETAPQGINLTVVRVETNQPGLYGLGCATSRIAMSRSAAHRDLSEAAKVGRRPGDRRAVAAMAW